MPEQTDKKARVVALNMKLTPVNHSDQPVSANFTTVGVAQGIAYLDFGFIEPAALASVVREARQGKEMPKSLEGKLAVRVALPLDGLLRLQLQLQQVLAGLRGIKGPKP